MSSEFDEFEPPLTLTTPVPPIPPPIPAPAPVIQAVSMKVSSAPSPSVPMCQSQHTCMPSCAVHKVVAGHAEGYMPGGFSQGLQKAISMEEQRKEVKKVTDDEEDSAEVETTIPAIKVDEDLFEYALAAEVSEVEALKLCTLTKVHIHSDWLLWE